MYKPRLRRLDRLFTPNPIYFVTSCTRQRDSLLDNNEVRQAFITFPQRAGERRGYVGRYTIMPDHLHFFVAFSSGRYRCG